MIRVNEMFERKQLKFTINQKVQLYIAFPETKPSPLTPDFKYADQKLSLLKVKPTDSPEKGKAELSIGYKIYYKTVVPGEVRFMNLGSGFLLCVCVCVCEVRDREGYLRY